ncbi:ribosome maturation factor RimM [Clostridium sp. SYSU_GA19001]|uniref:ribosome maturation factor RimM n=1 Tax=Clostridium caldaquaticum TaxID=2940653 RepID=UPI00207789AA|nr:ribosome maturation factor RimM [Clostridium caldaquaticum]MCM8710603.1 ribosome maturation factor RimM [Clostridium caldaquaticum]
MKEFLSVGQIINTHGIKGEVKIYPLTDDIKRFRKLKNVYIDGIEKKIVWCKLQSDKVILKIEGIDTIEQAQAFKNKYIEVSRKDAVKLAEGEYFIADLIGCKVFDSNNVEIGELCDVIKTGSNDVYWVKGKTEVLVPALKEIVLNIDVNERRIIIKPLEVWQ